MGPNEALKNARAALVRVREVNARQYTDFDVGEELADAFEALDGWLTNGGFLPKAWEAKR